MSGGGRRGAAAPALALAIASAMIGAALAGCGSDDPGAAGGAMPRIATMALVPALPIGLADRDTGDAATHGMARREVVGEVGENAAATTAIQGASGRVTRQPVPAEPAVKPPPTADPASLRPVFDLGDNRLLAHWYRDGGLHMVAGSPGFTRYVHVDRRDTSWRFGQRVEGVPVAVMRRAGILTVPLDDGAAARPGVIAARVHSGGRAQLSIAVNGAAPVEVLLVRGWQTVSVAVPARRWRVGENGVRLTLRGVSDVALAWLRVGGKPTDGGEGAGGAVDAGSASNDPDRLLSFFDPSDHSLRLSDREQLVYYLYLPDGALLAGTLLGDGADAAGCRLGVQVRAHLAALDAELAADRTRIDLDSLAGQVVRVRLELHGCRSAHLRDAGLQVAAPPPSRGAGPPPRHVILWIMDTLRADRIRPVSPGARPEVPAFERMAAEGAVFRQAYVQGNESQTSHASVWTSLYPARHNVRTAGNGGTWKLGDRFATLGETAHRAGLYATGVTANGMITRSGGYARGFDSFINLMRDGHPGRTNASIPGERILERALGTLAGREKDPFLLFVGTIDTHKPWIGHQPWLAQYDPGAYRGAFELAAHAGDLGIKRGSMRCTRTPNPRDLLRINAIYDSDVSYQDKVLGDLLTKLDQWDISDETMVIVTADHGEELWEDGRCGHGASLRDTLVHVPLFVRYPPLVPPGTVVEEGVDVLDVLPTMADALGLDPPTPSQGTSLLPLTHGVGRGYPRPSYASQYEYAHAMRVGNWKIWMTRTGGLELYDLANDPAERATVARRPIEARYMIDLLRMFLANRARWVRRDWGVVNNMSAAAPEALARPAGGESAGRRR
ncbi:MAG TPA: sulfatase [Kofleriaceae bacterium]|nr:sulfatase [Kofleriaceae bacterium]